MSYTEALRKTPFFLSLTGVFRLFRLSNSIPATILVFLGAYLAEIELMTSSIWVAAGAMWSITAFGYVSNDYFDVAEDCINKPDRPIPAGLISTRFAAWLSISLAVLTISLSISLGIVAIIASSAVLSLLTAYNIWFKGTPGGGNLVIALLAGCTLFVGSVAVNGLSYASLQPVWMPGLFLTTFITAREILKTVEDIEGDRHVGKQTFAIQWGVRCAIEIIAILTCLSILLSIAPIFYLGYSLPYLMVAMVGINLPLLYTVFTLWREAPPPQVSRCLALLKGSYFAGIVALSIA